MITYFGQVKNYVGQVLARHGKLVLKIMLVPGPSKWTRFPKPEFSRGRISGGSNIYTFIILTTWFLVLISLTTIYKQFINLFMPAAAKTIWLFWWYRSKKSNGLKIFDGELYIKTLPTTLLQIVYKLMLHSEVIFKSMTGPDDTHQVDFQALMG